MISGFNQDPYITVKTNSSIHKISAQRTNNSMCLLLFSRSNIKKIISKLKNEHQ